MMSGTKGKTTKDEFGLTKQQRHFADLCLSKPRTKPESHYITAYPKTVTWTERALIARAKGLLQHPNVSLYMKMRRHEAAVEVVGEPIVAVEKVLKEQSFSAFLDPGTMFDDDGRLLTVSQMPESTRRAIKSVKVRNLKGADEDSGGKVQIVDIQLNDKLTALKSIGEHLGMYVKRVEHSLSDRVRDLATNEIDSHVHGLMDEIEALKERRAAAAAGNGKPTRTH